MATNGKAPEPPGFMDRVRDLIAKIFGSPGRSAQAAEPVATGRVDVQMPERPDDKTRA